VSINFVDISTLLKNETFLSLSTDSFRQKDDTSSSFEVLNSISVRATAAIFTIMKWLLVLRGNDFLLIKKTFSTDHGKFVSRIKGDVLAHAKEITRINPKSDGRVILQPIRNQTPEQI
jgi:hypothetical protein